MFGKELSLRAILLGSLLSIIVSTYSAYAGLKIGGVYWPIITTSLISMALLGWLGKTNSREIVIMQTAASSGGLLAAGIIFTIPAAIMLGYTISYLELLLVSLLGGILGILFSYPLGRQLIDDEKLRCADGEAAASLIIEGNENGLKTKFLLYSLYAGAIFSFLRDFFRAIPSYFNLETLKIPQSNLFSFGSSISLIPLAGGFLIGLRFAAAWFAGAVFTYFVLLPYLVSTFAFSDKFAALAEVAKPLGIGIVIGSAIAFFLIKGTAFLRGILKDANAQKFKKMTFLALAFTFLFLSFIEGLPPAASLIALIGAFAMAYVASRSTGEMNVDPMEIYAFLIVIIARLLTTASEFSLIIVACIVTIAAGMAGDMMQDLKAGQILKAKREHQMVAQFFGLFASAIFASAIILMLSSNSGLGSVEFPAPQATALKALVSTDALTQIVQFGIAFGFALTFILNFIKRDFAMASIAFGIGMYVPIELSFPLFLGGVASHLAKKHGKFESGRLVASGLIAGEGIIAVSLSLLSFIPKIF